MRPRADDVVARLQQLRPDAADARQAGEIYNTVLDTLQAVVDDAALCDRLVTAHTTVQIEIVDAPEEVGRLALLLDREPVEIVAGPMQDPEVRVLLTLRDLARLWLGRAQLTVLISEGEAGYTGPVRKLLCVMPILAAGIRTHLELRDGTLDEVAGPAIPGSPRYVTPGAAPDDDAAVADLLDRAADYAEASGVHEEVAEFEERHPGEFWSIRCRSVTKAFGSNVVLDGLDFSIPEGLITVVLGPSGTGKSVLINHLIGLVFPEHGEVVVHGESLSDMRRSRLSEVRKEFGILFQDGALFGSMSMYDNVAFPLRQHTDRSEADIRERVMGRLADVGLADHARKMPNELSGGMKKRAGFARALMLDPSIVLFDEPDSGLDPVRTGLLCELIRETHAHYGGTYVVITHDIASARQVGQYIAVLWKGRIVQAGSAERMFASENPFVHQFLNRDLQGPLGME